MTTRRASLLRLGLVLASTSPAVIAQTRARVGWLTTYPPQARPGLDRALSIFFQRLRQLGWNEGENLAFELRGRSAGESLDAGAKALLALKCDVLITSGTEAVRLLRDSGGRVPIVMAGVGDPAGAGLVESLARPGGSVTGVSMVGQEIFTKIVGLLREVKPEAKRVHLLTAASNPANAFFSRVITEAARSQGLASAIVEVPGVDGLEQAIAAAPADVLVVNSDPSFFNHLQRMAAVARRRMLPMASNDFGELTRAGGLFSYAPDTDEINRQVAEYADRILRGANPAETPVAQPRRYRFVVNLDTASALKVKVPAAHLVLADEVIR